MKKLMLKVTVKFIAATRKNVQNVKK